MVWIKWDDFTYFTLWKVYQMKLQDRNTLEFVRMVVNNSNECNCINLVYPTNFNKVTYWISKIIFKCICFTEQAGWLDIWTSIEYFVILAFNVSKFYPHFVGFAANKASSVIFFSSPAESFKVIMRLKPVCRISDNINIRRLLNSIFFMIRKLNQQTAPMQETRNHRNCMIFDLPI